MRNKKDVLFSIDLINNFEMTKGFEGMNLGETGRMLRGIKLAVFLLSLPFGCRQ